MKASDGSGWRALGVWVEGRVWLAFAHGASLTREMAACRALAAALIRACSGGREAGRRWRSCCWWWWCATVSAAACLVAPAVGLEAALQLDHLRDHAVDLRLPRDISWVKVECMSI